MGIFALSMIILALIGATVAGLSKNSGAHWGSAALIVSLVGALTAGQVLDSIQVLMPVLLIGLMLAYHWKSPAGYAISALYVVRTAWLCVEYYEWLPVGWWFGLENRTVFWDINNGLVGLQALLAIYGGRVNGGFRIRRPLAHVALARARFRRDIHLSAWLPATHPPSDRSR